MILASVCIIIGALYFGREVLIPLALAMLLSFLLSAPVRWLERIRLPRAAAVIIVVLLAVGLLGGIGYIVGRQFADVVRYQFPKYQAQLEAKVKRFGEHGGILKTAQKDLRSIASAARGSSATKPAPAANRAGASGSAASDSATGGADDNRSEETSSGTALLLPQATPPNQPTTRPTPENPMPVRLYPQTGLLELLRNYAATILSPLATAGLVIVFVIFMLLSREDLRDRFIRLVGHGRLNLTTQAMDEVSTRISGYLGALAIVNGAYALCVAGGLWAIGRFIGGHGFPNVLVWGILVGLFRFVPYIGIWIGAAAPLLLSFALFKGNAPFFATVGLFAILEIAVAQFIEPFWYGSSTGMSALAVLVAAVFWTWLWGPIGLLLSTPLTVCMVVMGKYVPQLKFIDILLREEPVLAPHARFYQRLIAGDQEEAAEQAETYLREKNSLEATYDNVLIPALVMAEQDNHRGRLEDRLYVTIRQAIREIVEELADQHRLRLEEESTGEAASPRGGSILAAAASSVAAAASTVAHVVTGAPEPAPRSADLPAGQASQPTDADGQAVHRRPHLPHDCVINVLCLPARGDADEIVAGMLALLLEARGYCTFVATTDVLAGEMVNMVQARNADLVCVSAMPPAALSHARYLCKRLHARYADIKMIVGLWQVQNPRPGTGAGVSLEHAKQRIGCSSDLRVVGTLHDAQEQIEQFARPLAVLRVQSQATSAEPKVSGADSNASGAEPKVPSAAPTAVTPMPG